MKEKVLSFFLLIIMLLFISFIVGCIGELPNSSAPHGEGITNLPQVNGSEKMGWQDVFNQIRVMNSESKNISQPLKIFSITGFKPDFEGKSDAWLLIVKQGDYNKFIELSQNDVQINKWYGNIPEKEIVQEKIVTPDNFFKKYQTRLKEYSGAGWIFEKLDLNNGLFNLSLIKGADKKIFSFNAENGDFLGVI